MKDVEDDLFRMFSVHGYEDDLYSRSYFFLVLLDWEKGEEVRLICSILISCQNCLYLFVGKEIGYFFFFSYVSCRFLWGLPESTEWQRYQYISGSFWFTLNGYSLGRSCVAQVGFIIGYQILRPLSSNILEKSVFRFPFGI